MGIDGIGKKGPPGLQPPEVTPARWTRTGSAFELRPTAPISGSAPPSAPALQGPSTALERLRAGEIDVNRYLDLKVDDATAHLVFLPSAQLQAVRQELRDRLAVDPTLVELVAEAARGAPQSTHEE